MNGDRSARSSASRPISVTDARSDMTAPGYPAIFAPVPPPTAAHHSAALQHPSLTTLPYNGMAMPPAESHAPEIDFDGGPILFHHYNSPPPMPLPTIGHHHPSQTGHLPYHPSPLWNCAGANQGSSSAWCSVRSPGDVAPEARGPESSLSRRPYEAAPVSIAASTAALVPGIDACLGRDVGSAANSESDEDLRLPQSPPSIPTGALTHFHVSTVDAAGQLIPLQTSFSAYALPGFHHGVDHFDRPAVIGPEPLPQPPSLLQDSGSGWRGGYPDWQHTPLGAGLTESCATSLDGQRRGSSGNVTNLGPQQIIQPPRNRKTSTRARRAAHSGSEPSRTTLHASASSSGLSKDIPSRQKMKPYMNQFPTNPTKRRAFTEERRLEVAETRKKGACFTCRLQKGTCGGGVPGDGAPCKTCSSRRERSPTLVILCYRLDLNDCCVFRRASPLHRVEGRESMSWAAAKADAKPLKVTMTGLVETKPLEVHCRYFRPVDTDRVDKNIGCSGELWSIPPFAAVSFAEIRKALQQDSLDWCDGLISALRSPPPGQEIGALGEWLHLARQYADCQPGSLTRRALQLWTGARLTQIERGLVGEETLGTGKVQDDRSALNGLVPIPPILDLQIDTVIIRWMNDVQETLMKDLFNTIRSKKRRDLFDIFLTIFVLASAAECVALEQEEFAKEFKDSKEDPQVYVHIKEFSDGMIEHLDWSVKHLVYTFRKAAEHIMPVGQPSLSKAAGMAELSEQERKRLEHALEFLIDGSAPIKMEYTTTAGVSSQLSWIVPLLERR